MKLRNKKTGEIIELLAKPSFVKRNDDYLQSEVNTFNSLAELNEEWEDYEEPEDFWFIDPEILIACESTDPLLCDKKVAIETMKQIGNYFETKEEAVKAVKKLKAWKRLKDKGFRFSKWFTRVEGGIQINMEYNKYDGIDSECRNDLDLLFRGEE